MYFTTFLLVDAGIATYLARRLPTEIPVAASTMAGPSVVSPGTQGQDGKAPTPPSRTTTAKDATGTVLRATEKELAFTLKIPNSATNLAKIHKTFVDALYRATDNEVTLLCSNTRSLPVPEPLREPNDFPKNDSDHRNFFRRHSNQRDTLVHHTIITPISIDELKKRLLLTLQAHNLWMTNDSLKSKEMSVIAFVWKAPTRLIHRPTFAKKLNDYLSKMELNFEQVNLLKRASNDAELPELPQVYVNIRTIKHGNINRVETEAPAILTNKPYARLMKELVSQIPLDAIGYDIVPCGMVAKIGEENYRNALLANNDYNNNIRSIEILYLHTSHFELRVTNHNNESGTIGDWFASSPIIIDVQPSNRSEEIGKYFIIVQDQHIAQARREVAFLLRVFQENPDAYGKHFPRFPCIANGPLSDGATERTAEALSKKFATLQSEPPPTTQPDSITAWTPTRNACVFDWNSTREFPAPPTSGQPSPPATPKQARVTINEDSTHARSTRSPYTNDVDTTVSDLKTVFTESMAAQSAMLQTFMQHSQQQQQQLMAAHQSQQASTNQILHHISSLMSTMVSGPNPTTKNPTPPIPSSVNVSPAAPIQPHLRLATQSSPLDQPNQSTTASVSSSQNSPQKRPAPDSQPERRRGTTPKDSDTTMSNADQTYPSTATTEASTTMDFVPGSAA
jgi:hypothetical protein